MKWRIPIPDGELARGFENVLKKYYGFKQANKLAEAHAQVNEQLIESVNRTLPDADQIPLSKRKHSSIRLHSNVKKVQKSVLGLKGKSKDPERIESISRQDARALNLEIMSVLESDPDGKFKPSDIIEYLHPFPWTLAQVDYALTKLLAGNLVQRVSHGHWGINKKKTPDDEKKFFGG